MNSDCPAFAQKLSKPISKGNRTWRKVNKLTSRLRNKGVPSSILTAIDSMPEVTRQTLSGLNFEYGVGLQEMTALAKIQSIEALTLNLNRRMDVDLKKKSSEMTEAGEQSCFTPVKENICLEQPSTVCSRPQ